MSKVETARNLGVAQRYSEAMGRLQQPGDYALVARGIPRAVVMACPDGCGGEPLVINLDRQSGPAWRHYHTAGLLSLYPSVWRDDGCRAHFILLRDKLYWCGGNDTAGDFTVEESMVSAVLRRLDSRRPEHYLAVATALGAIPWDVAWACSALVRAGLAREPQREFFVRTR